LRVANAVVPAVFKVPTVLTASCWKVAPLATRIVPVVPCVPEKNRIVPASMFSVPELLKPTPRSTVVIVLDSLL